MSSSIVRDFSSSAKLELINMCNQVESEKLSNFTDWVGDRWYEFEESIGRLSIEKYIDNVNAYHKKVIDKNNATYDDIIAIFEAVNTVSSTYVSKFSAAKADVTELRKVIDQFTAAVDPANGNFDPDYIGDLQAAVDAFKTTSGALQEIYDNDGLDEEDLSELDEEEMSSLINSFCEAYVDPDLKLSAGTSMEIPVGPNTTFYYKASITGGSGDITINTEVDDDEILTVKNIKISTDGTYCSSSVTTDGKITVTQGNMSVSGDLMSGGVTTTYIYEISDTTTAKYTNSFGLSEGKAEMSVTVKADDVSATTTAGIKITSDNNNWSQPVSVPVTSESTSTETSNDVSWGVDWEALGITVAAVGGAAIAAMVAKKIVGLAGIPFTGGASLVLVVTP